VRALICCVSRLHRSVLLCCREPATNLADNLLRDFEQRWWGAVKKVRPGHARTHAVRNALQCKLSAACQRSSLCCSAVQIPLHASDHLCHCHMQSVALCAALRCAALHCTAVVLMLCYSAAATALQGDEEAIASMMAVGGDVLARTGECGRGWALPRLTLRSPAAGAQPATLLALCALTMRRLLCSAACSGREPTLRPALCCRHEQGGAGGAPAGC
jgi:hypothetical protein